MSKQIAVRLSDDLVDFVDSIVAILAASGPDADLAGSANHAVDVPVNSQIGRLLDDQEPELSNAIRAASDLD